MSNATKQRSRTVYDMVEGRGYFSYSGEDGDLYRHQKLPGWRLSLSVHSFRIHKKDENWEYKKKRGYKYWSMVFSVDPELPGAKDLFHQALVLLEREQNDA